MTKTCKPHSIRLLAVSMLLLLLNACALPPFVTQPSTDSTPSAATPAPAANGNATTVAKIIPARQEITVASSIEKNNLSISYSLKPIQGKHEELLRLTLIFKNQSDKSRRIWPHVYLLDAQDKAVKSYSLQTLRRVLSGGAKPAAPKDGASHMPGEWTDMYWLKKRYQIPPHGIAIGELVYHGKQFNFPLKLTVRIYKDFYKFTAEQP